MSESSLVDRPDDAFAALMAARRLASEEARQKALRRSVVVVAVALLHVLLLSIFIVSERIPRVPRIAQPVEVQLTLVQPQRRTVITQPKVINAIPEVKPAVREVVPAPITPQVTPQPTEGDAMKALGIALACGASRYEYLSPVERKLCKHRPWNMPKDKNLAILPPPIPALGQMTGAEAMAKMRAQAPPCPLEQQTPCIHTIIYGKGPQ